MDRCVSKLRFHREKFEKFVARNDRAETVMEKKKKPGDKLSFSSCVLTANIRSRDVHESSLAILNPILATVGAYRRPATKQYCNRT